MFIWKTDAETQAKVEAFNTELEARRNNDAKLTFRPQTAFEDDAARDFSTLEEPPLLALYSVPVSKYTYYISLGCIVVAVLLFFYIVPLILAAQGSYERLLLPVTICVGLIIFGLAYGLPPILYFHRREILLFPDKLVFVRRKLNDRLKIIRTRTYQDLREIAVGSHFRNTDRPEITDVPNPNRYPAWALTFQNPDASVKRYIISGYSYADVEAKIAFWQNNLVWQ